MASSVQGEQIFYDANGVTVGSKLLRFPEQTIPVTAINSVTFGTYKTNRWWVGLVIFGVSAGIGLLIPDGFIVACFFGFALGGIVGCVMGMRATSSYGVLLSTSSGDIRAFTTEFEDDARELVTAVEKALSA
jgi:hypothetical protein